MPDLPEIYRMLQRGEHAEALAALDRLEPLTAREQATRLAWRGQALRALGRPAEGAADVIQAIRITKKAGVHDDLPALRELHADIARSAAALLTTDRASQGAEALLAEPLTGMGPDRLLERAQAAAERGLDADALAAAQSALAACTDVRQRVLSLLVIGRFDGPDHIHLAHHLADTAADENLLTAVARTAKLLGVRLHRPSFG